MKDFEYIPHTADIKIKVYGQTKEELFVHALQGMFQSVGPIIPECKKEEDRVICDDLPIKREIIIESPDIDALLVDFLSEAIYLCDVYNEVYLDAEITQLADKKIVATLFGIAIEGFDVVELKAVTYHELSVKQIYGVWQTYIVFDI